MSLSTIFRKQKWMNPQSRIIALLVSGILLLSAFMVSVPALVLAQIATLQPLPTVPAGMATLTPTNPILIPVFRTLPPLPVVPSTVPLLTVTTAVSAATLQPLPTVPSMMATLTPTNPPIVIPRFRTLPPLPVSPSPSPTFAPGMPTNTPAPTLPPTQVPALSFPALTGAYAVGMTRRAYTDPVRFEDFSPDPLDFRRVPVTFFYPAVPAPDAQRGDYGNERELSLFQQYYGIRTTYSLVLRPNFYVDAPASAGAFPVLLFMPGLGSPTLLYRSILEQIASHGYIIAVIDPVYSSSFSVFPDGTFAVANRANLDNPTDETVDLVFQSWMADANLVLTLLSDVNANDPLLGGRLNLEKLGAFGHSFGGAVAIQLAHDNNRVLSALNMDGKLQGSIVAEGIAKPVMLILSEQSQTGALAELSDENLAFSGLTRDQLSELLATLLAEWQALLTSAPRAYQIVPAGSINPSYLTDLGILRTLLPQAITDDVLGAIDGTRTIDIVTDYTTAFFDSTLQGIPSPLLEAASADYPDVDFTRFSR